MIRALTIVTGLLGGVSMAAAETKTYYCPVLGTGPAETAGQWAVQTSEPNRPSLSAVEVFDGAPDQGYQIAPSVAATDDGFIDTYNMAEINAPVIQCRYDDTPLQAILTLDPAIESCTVAQTNGVFSPQITCE